MQELPKTFAIKSVIFTLISEFITRKENNVSIK